MHPGRNFRKLRLRWLWTELCGAVSVRTEIQIFPVRLAPDAEERQKVKGRKEK